MIEVVSFANTLTDASEYRISSVFGCDIVYEFLNEDRFADSSASEKTRLPSLNERSHEVDRFDTCFKHFSFCALACEHRRFAEYRKSRGIFRCRSAIYRLSDDVKHSSERCFTDWNTDRSTGVCYFYVARKAGSVL